MTTRFGILAGPRGGKTTLIQQLYVDMKIMCLDVGVATEYSTDYLRDKGMIETIAEQYGIYLGQFRIEDQLSVHDYALTDYATFVPYIYGRFMIGNRKRTVKEIEILKDLYNLALNDIGKYDYIFFLPREFGYERDGVRWQDEEVALAVDNAIKAFLDNEHITYREVDGTTKERTEKILDILGLKKDEK